MAFIFKISFLGFLKQNLIDLLTKSTTEEPLIAMVPQEKSTLFTFSFVPAPSWSWSQTCIIWCLGKVPMSGPTTDLFEFCSWEFRCWQCCSVPQPTWCSWDRLRGSSDPLIRALPWIATDHRTTLHQGRLGFLSFFPHFLTFLRLSLLVSFPSGWLGTILCSLANQCFAMPGQLFLPPLIAPPSFIWRWLLMPTHYHFLHTFKDHLWSDKLSDFIFSQVFPSFSSSSSIHLGSIFSVSFPSTSSNCRLWDRSLGHFCFYNWWDINSDISYHHSFCFSIIRTFSYCSVFSLLMVFFWNER